MDRLLVRVLGPLVVTHDREPVTAFESDKIRALLAYLAVEAARPHPRESLAELFWPDRPAGAGLSNLRHALTILRRAIGSDQADPPYLLISRQTIQWNNAVAVHSDYDQFTSGITQPTNGDAGMVSLEEAVALVRGPFLDGISGGDSAALDEWLLLKREEVNAQLLHALSRLTAGAELEGLTVLPSIMLGVKLNWRRGLNKRTSSSCACWRLTTAAAKRCPIRDLPPAPC